ncbi:IS3 family transposase [Nocardia cyriacigeorgica]|uniref:IS3 family transposase n=2 Tax=Nocardia cyriacigeorgica TaxID=135487 RepID=UPI003CC80DE0
MKSVSSKRYPPELRERAVRMVAEIRDQHSTEWAAMAAVAELLGIGSTETVRKWMRQAQVDAGSRAGVTSEESAELKRLRRENAELKRANAILKTASAFFAAEIDRPAADLQVRHRTRRPPRQRRPAVGVESICAALGELGVNLAPSTYYEHRNRVPSARRRRDEALTAQIRRVHRENFGVYGARKVWLQLNREGYPVARCTVERLMREAGLRGISRGRAKRTTIADPVAPTAADLVQRRFAPAAPNRLWVSDITYVSTWSGWVYVAFVIDAYARRILGWRLSTSMTTTLVLDAIEHAIWTREREGWNVKDVVHHTDRGSQYTAIAFTERLAEAGIQPSVGAVGSSYDNALAETINGLYKTELIKPRGPWRSVDQVEFATAEWVDWFNHRRLYQYCGDLPPAEMEAAHYAQHPAQQPAGLSHQ